MLDGEWFHEQLILIYSILKHSVTINLFSANWTQKTTCLINLHPERNSYICVCSAQTSGSIMQRFEDLHGDLGSIPLPGNTINTQTHTHMHLSAPHPLLPTLYICVHFTVCEGLIKMPACNKFWDQISKQLCFVFWSQPCAEGAASYFRCIPSVLSFMSMLSWRLRRQAGESTSIFQESFRWLFLDAASPPLIRVSWQEHTSKPFPITSVLCWQLYSSYLCIMYIHMYTIIKSVVLPM